MGIPLLDRIVLTALIAASVLLAVRGWLHDHPQHDPRAPLDLADPPGWATGRKLAALRDDGGSCRAFLDRSGIAMPPLPPAGSGACRREDRAVLTLPPGSEARLSPEGAQATCAVGAALAWWLQHGVQPAAETILRARVVGIEHLGTYNCRRIGGGDSGNWSEHATGNALDISAFVLADGRRIVVREDWNGDGPGAAFLRATRDGACRAFATVLSPEYNAAHADHLHFDQARRGSGWRACR